MNACDNIIALARELGVGRRLLYVWRDRFGETDPPPQRSRELILRKQIRKLKRLEAVWLVSLSSGQVQAPSYQNNCRAGETAARCHW
jgi:transposase-like protein